MTAAPRPHLMDDPYLEPYLEELKRRFAHVGQRRREVLDGRLSLLDVADWHEKYGLHQDESGNWLFREWLPNATSAVLLGDFNDWTPSQWYELHPVEGSEGDWGLHLPESMIEPGQRYQLHVSWNGGAGWRLPSAVRQVQRERREDGHILFNAVAPSAKDAYAWKNDDRPLRGGPLFIYEAHPGIALQERKIGTFAEFAAQVLPRIAADGYNCLQLMAVAQHPYYASFGYHVANYFAVAECFGTPNDLKALVDAAHGLGLRVIMDLVHSHHVKNELEGLGRLCGDTSQFFCGEHPAWNSYCFDYAKPQVARFLLSNCRFWLEEYHLDGFRFDGVTSMLYLDHGLNRAFTSYRDYFTPNTNWDAVAYLTMANEVCHLTKPQCLTIAEDVSGMPGLAAPVEEGGMGFDMRLAMGVTDYWFKLLDCPDEYWDMGHLWHELVNRRPEEHTISYVECHDQAIVGGQTFLYRCLGNAMYDAMDLEHQSLVVDRGIALHKMSRLATAATADAGYMNFIGNEFGHPEWVDFPREGNGWSFEHACRRWDLCDDPKLRYGMLDAFDNAMLALLSDEKDLYDAPARQLWLDTERHIIAFDRGGLLFVFNFHPVNSYCDWKLPVPHPEYALCLDTDEARFNGFGRLVSAQHYHALQGKAAVVPYSLQPHTISLYLPARTALVLRALQE